MKKILKEINIIPLTWGTSKELTLIVDTNVLSYMLIPEARIQIDNLLQRYKEAEKITKFKIVETISAVSVYECLQGEREQEYLNIFKLFKCYELDLSVQYLAAKLKLFYLKHGVTINNLPDLYISATSLLNASAILTANQSDYPDLLFKESYAQNIRWKEKNRTKGIMLYLLRPDYIKAKEKKFITVIES